MIFKVVGVTFDGRQDVLKELYGRHSDTPIPGQLVEEPENPFDDQAIAVYVDDQPIGHIGKFDLPDFHQYKADHGELPQLVAVRIGAEAIANAWNNITRFYATFACKLFD